MEDYFERVPLLCWSAMQIYCSRLLYRSLSSVFRSDVIFFGHFENISVNSQVNRPLISYIGHSAKSASYCRILKKEPLNRGSQKLNVKAEVHDISVFHNIFFSFEADFSCFFGSCHIACSNKVVIGNCFCTNEPFFKV